MKMQNLLVLKNLLRLLKQIKSDMKKKIVVDPDKVIKVEPRKVKTPSDMFMGFFYGWMSLYLLLKLFQII